MGRRLLFMASIVATLVAQAVAAPHSEEGIRPLLGMRCNETVDAPPLQGVRIDWLDPRGVAAALGLRLKDVVVSVNDQPIRQASDLGKVMSTLMPGAPLRIVYARMGVGRGTVEGWVPIPPRLPHYVVVEGVGLPGIISLGEFYDVVRGRLGEPSESGYIDRLRLVACYPSWGIEAQFCGRGLRCEAIHIRFPFVGHLYHGVTTDDTRAHVLRAYGVPAELETYQGSMLRLHYPRLHMWLTLDGERDRITQIDLYAEEAVR